MRRDTTARFRYGGFGGHWLDRRRPGGRLRGLRGCRGRLGGRFGWRRGLGQPACGRGVEGGDHRAVIPRRLRPRPLKARHDLLDAIERLQDQRDAIRRDRQFPVAVAPEHILGRMRDRLQPRQAQEAAGALDGVDDAEDLRQGRLVLRRFFEPHQRHVERSQALMGLGQKVRDQVVHGHSVGRPEPQPAPDEAKKR